MCIWYCLYMTPFPLLFCRSRGQCFLMSQFVFCRLSYVILRNFFQTTKPAVEEKLAGQICSLSFPRNQYQGHAGHRYKGRVYRPESLIPNSRPIRIASFLSTSVPTLPIESRRTVSWGSVPGCRENYLNPTNELPFSKLRRIHSSTFGSVEPWLHRNLGITALHPGTPYYIRFSLASSTYAHYSSLPSQRSRVIKQY